MRRYYTPDMLRRVTISYAVDYALFGLPVPSLPGEVPRSKQLSVRPRSPQSHDRTAS